MEYFIFLNNGFLISESNLFCLVAKTAPIKPIHNVICCTSIADAGIPGRPINLVRISKAGKKVNTANTAIAIVSSPHFKRSTKWFDFNRAIAVPRVFPI